MKHQQIMSLLAGENPEDIREGAFQAGNVKLDDAIPLLVKHIGVSSPGVQEAVDSALRCIGGESVMYAVLPYLRSEDPPVRNMAMDLLREVGSSNVLALTELLQDADSDIRIFGADILGSTGSVIAVQALGTALLSDHEVNVRYQAAVSLGNLAFLEAAKYLNQALEDEEWVQFAVIEALIKVGAESSINALIQAFDNSSELVSSVIVDAIAEMKHIKAVPLLMKRLEEANIPMANKIVRAIVSIMGEHLLKLMGVEAYDSLKPYMLQALHDEDVAVQDAAVRGLAVDADGESFDAVFALLTTLNPDMDMERMQVMIRALSSMGYHEGLAGRMRDGADSERTIAVEVMSGIDDSRVYSLLRDTFWECSRDIQRMSIGLLASACGRECMPFFIEVLDRQKDGTIAKAVIHYLSRQKDADILRERVFPLLEHPYNDVKEAALEALIAVKDPLINARCREMSKQDNPLYRMMAIYAMGSYGAEENLQFIAAGLKDESPDVRRTAVEAMVADTSSVPRDLVKLLRPCLADWDRGVRLAAIEALSGCNNEESADYLLQGLADEDQWIRARCATGLGKKRLRTAAPAIANLLRDDNTLVVIKAIEALSALGGEDAFKQLIHMMEHHDPEVQRAAEGALDKIRREAGA